MRMKAIKYISILIILLITAATAALAADTVYVVNSFGRHSPAPHWSTVAVLRSPDLAILKTVTVGYDAHYAAVTPDGRRLWVTSRGSNNISVIDTESLKVLKNIEGDFLVAPLGVAFTPDGTRAYVAFESSGKVGIFDGERSEYISSLNVGGNPSYVLLTPDGSKAYVVDFLNSELLAIRTSDNAVVANLKFRGRKLQNAVVSPDGSKVGTI
jgi:YVTN family beta-propeller protein